MNWADQVSPMYSNAQKRTTDYVLENLCDVEYLRLDDELSVPVKMDETNQSILRMVRSEAESNVLLYESELDAYAKKLVENMEYRKDASETGRT